MSELRGATMAEQVQDKTKQVGNPFVVDVSPQGGVMVWGPFQTTAAAVSYAMGKHRQWVTKNNRYALYMSDSPRGEDVYKELDKNEAEVVKKLVWLD